MTTFYARAIVWVRRDLRLCDHVALAAAAEHAREICIAFNIDTLLLASDRVGAPLVQGFFDALASLRAALRDLGSDVALSRGNVAAELIALARRIGAGAVFYNEDYAPESVERDARVTHALRDAGIDVYSSLDHVCFGANEICNTDGEPYRIYTSYRKRWRARYGEHPRVPVPSESLIQGKLLGRAAIGATLDIPAPEAFGFVSSPEFPPCGEPIAREMLDAFFAPGGAAEHYADRRDMPAVEGTSQLSPQLRAGTIGIRTCFDRAFEAVERRGAMQIEKWIDELIWREFYQMILKAFPRVASGPFIEAAALLHWDDNRALFEKWCRGLTGYPIVDAAMRHLNETGWMHNRLRMIVASFLTKDLLLNWQWGERYFEQHLADADLAQNNGGWQWAASTGTDAAPYFRVFNPVLQSKKCDPDGRFIRRILPEIAKLPSQYIHEPWETPPALQAEYGCRIGTDYPAPVIDHEHARRRALARYESVLGKLG